MSDGRSRLRFQGVITIGLFGSASGVLFGANQPLLAALCFGWALLRLVLLVRMELRYHKLDAPDADE